MHSKYLIIGGGIAGTTAAETIRQHDTDGSIAIISDEPHRLYSRILLSKPNFFLGKLPFDSIWLKTPEWYREQNIEFIAGKKAIALDRETKIITLTDGQKIQYEKLLLAVGGCVRSITIPGEMPGDILYLRTLDDAQTIIERVAHSKRGVIIGGGFIGFEMCEMMQGAGMDATLIIREPRFWEIFLDEQGSRIIEQALKTNGVNIIRGVEIQEITRHATERKLVLSNKASIPFDMIIAGVGISCPLGWITEAGIETHLGIQANEYLETSDQNIWTAGDSAEFFDPILRDRVLLGNWVNAQVQGRIAGKGMIGSRSSMHLVSSYITSGFGVKIAFVGNLGAEYPTVIIRFDPASQSYARLLINDGKLVGAALLNRTQELAVISKLIEREVVLDSKLGALRDPAFPLSKLLQNY